MSSRISENRWRTSHQISCKIVLADGMYTGADGVSCSTTSSLFIQSVSLKARSRCSGKRDQDENVYVIGTGSADVISWRALGVRLPAGFCYSVCAPSLHARRGNEIARAVVRRELATDVAELCEAALGCTAVIFSTTHSVSSSSSSSDFVLLALLSRTVGLENTSLRSTPSSRLTMQPMGDAGGRRQLIADDGS